MRWLAMRCIEAYWRLSRRQQALCIFRESCSRRVYRAFSEDGTYGGLRALYSRWRQCRSGYRAEIGPDGTPSVVVLVDGSRVPITDLAEWARPRFE